ncbi:hypothetical protein SERLADRAFT_437051 [Serpula lacrymans var. lacrymans S7.9]|uniref:AB hydrolase-1 domain-containing protein n=1 Tax=Serpula lacrymans var. lacrymans (strain S7.9) TaxID=578457 RepID=F8NUX8_SERL9|nr:uncharacterized protein SERLADRAFT_437051 [Serpula lacrymans var. lacrymans S7.9]EGO25293.1 hypothetical protein SERLADRAFT_437051 [Serpula lacrymans var. lacrymans S7.9]
MTTPPDIKYYHHGRFKVTGGILPDAVTAYQTYGSSNNPCIVFPTCYGAKLALGSQDYLIGDDKALDPCKYFIVTFALFCNGESSSPSNTPAPYNGAYFPSVSYEDNIFLEGPKSAMLASKDYADGHYTTTPQHGIRAFGRVYSAWAYGQTWFREHKYLMNGEYPDLNSFIRERWEARYLQYWDANDMIALLSTWQNGDISKVQDGGNYEKALSSIKAKALLMPSKTDLYFPPEDSQNELSHLKDAKLHVINTVWGHVAGGGANPSDVEFITARILEFLK